MNHENPYQTIVSAQQIMMARKYLENMKSYVMNDDDRKRNLAAIYNVVDSLNDLDTLSELKDLVGTGLPRDLGNQIFDLYDIERRISYRIDKVKELKVIKTEGKSRPEQEKRLSA